MREILGEAPGKPYSRGTRCGNLVFVSGQLGWDANDDPVPGGAGPQTRQCLEYVKEVLALAGASLDDVTMVNVYLHDLDRDYDAMNAVYREYFGTERLPARATVGVSRLAKGLLVEISCIAVLGLPA